MRRTEVAAILLISEGGYCSIELFCVIGDGLNFALQKLSMQ